MNIQQGTFQTMFLLPAWRISDILGLIPFYSIHKHELIFKKLFKCYSIFLALAMTSLSIFCITSRFYYVYDYAVFFNTVLEFLTEILGIISYITTTFCAAFYNIDRWQMFINRVRFLESKWLSLERKTFRVNGNLIFFVGNICHFSIFVVTIVVIQRIRSYVSTILLFYIDFVMTNIVINLVILVKYKLEDINVFLMEFKFGEHRLEPVKRYLLMVEEHVDDFNELLGWSMLGIISHLFSQLLSCLTIFTLDNSHLHAFYVSLFCYGIIIGFGPVMLLFCCDLAVAEAKKCLTSCHRLLQYLPVNSKESKDLKRLESILRNKPPIFTAAGFFELNRSTLLYLFSTITTYFIVAIQLKNKK